MAVAVQERTLARKRAQRQVEAPLVGAGSDQFLEQQEPPVTRRLLESERQRLVAKRE